METRDGRTARMNSDAQSTRGAYKGYVRHKLLVIAVLVFIVFALAGASIMTGPAGLGLATSLLQSSDRATSTT